MDNKSFLWVYAGTILFAWVFDRLLQRAVWRNPETREALGFASRTRRSIGTQLRWGAFVRGGKSSCLPKRAMRTYLALSRVFACLAIAELVLHLLLVAL